MPSRSIIRLGVPRARVAPLAQLLLGLAATQAHAQEPSRGLWLQTGVALDGAVTETRSQPGGGNGIEYVARVSPSVRLGSRSGLNRYQLAYSGTAIGRGGGDAGREKEFQNSLDADAHFEPVPGRLFLDARASVSQQATDPYGLPIVSSVERNSNRTEVAQYSLAPGLKGSLGGFANYDLRVTAQRTDNRHSSVADTDTTLVSATIGSPSGGAVVGWSAYGSSQRADFGGALAPTRTDRAGIELVLVPDIDWRLSARGGRESSDVTSATRQTYDNYGGGIQWTPSPRARFSVQGEQRYFGRSHRAILEYRLPRTTLRYADAREVTGGSAVGEGTRPVTLFEMMFTMFAATEPDPARRTLLVLDLLRMMGRDPAETVSGGFLTPGTSVQRRQDLSAVWSAARQSVAINLYRVQTERIDTAAALTPGATDPVVQTGYTATAMHRLTPQTSINLGGGRQMTHPGPTAPGTDYKTAHADLSSRLGRSVTGAIGLRYSVFNSAVAPSRTTSVNASISLTF